MKRFHVHVAVKDLQESLRFYSTLFGAAPTVTQPDYAKWMLDDPRINFAISNRGHSAGINHLGIPDAAAATGTDAQIAKAFVLAFEQLHRRVSLFTSLRLDSLDRLALQERINEIGQTRE